MRIIFGDILTVNPFPLIRFRTQQTTFENILTRGENEQFLLLAQCFQIFSIIKPLFMEIFHVFANIFSRSSSADLFYVGKGYAKKSLTDDFEYIESKLKKISMNENKTTDLLLFPK